MDDTLACPLCFTANPAPRAGSGPVRCRACGEAIAPVRVPRAPAAHRPRVPVRHDSFALDEESRQIVILDESLPGPDAATSPGRAPSSADETIRLEAPQPQGRAVRLSPISTPPPASLARGEAEAPAPAAGAPTVRATGKFAVVEELNRGGMGVILRGRDKSLHREVAIKVIRDQQSPLQRARFIKEAQVTGQLEHPNIVPVHEFGVDEAGRLFFAMKLVRGRTLAEILAWHRDDPAAATVEFPLTRLVGILIQVSHAVAFAHTRGVVHRDLKPGNIMLGDFGEVMLMDWGLAKVGVAGAVGGETLDEGAAGGGAPAASDSTAALVVADGDSSAQRRAPRLDVTQDGAVIGTPAYMAPEQAAGLVSRIDARSDVYALGAILYEFLTLAPPVAGGDIDEVLRNATLNHIVAPHLRAPGRNVPKDLAAVAMKALAADPEDRYPGAAALRRDLERFIEGRAVSARSDNLLEVAGKFVRRHRIATMVAAVAVAALLAVGVAGFWFNLAARHRAEAARTSAESERGNAERQRAHAEAQTRVAAAALAAADEQRRIAEEERRKAQSAFAAELVSRAQSELHDHLAAVALAGEQIDHDEFAAAGQLLDGCPVRLRDWVWRRLGLLCHQELAGLPGQAGALAVSADGGRLASADAAGTVTFYELPGLRALGSCAGFGEVRALAITADGGAVACASADGALRWWRAGGAPRLLATAAAPCTALAFTSDAGLLSGDADGAVALWDTASGARTALGALGEAVRVVGAARGGGRLIAGGGAGAVRLWSATGAPITDLRLPGAVLAVSPVAPLVLLAAPRGALLWDLLRGRALATLAGHGRDVTCAGFAPDGGLVATGSADRTVRIWSLAGGPALLVLRGHGDRLATLGFAGGARLASVSDDGSLRLWDAQARHDLAELPRVPGLSTALLSPDGGRVLTASTHGIATLSDLSSRQALRTLVQGPAIRAAAFAADGRRFATVGDGGLGRIWSAQDGRLLTSIAAPPPALAAACFSPDGGALLTGGADGALRVWAVEDGRPLAMAVDQAGALAAVAWSPDGRLLVAAGADGALRVRRAVDLAVVLQFFAPGPVAAVRFSPDGQLLAAASGNLVQTWAVADGAPRALMRGHSDAVRSVAFSADGAHLLSASADGTARIWDASSGRVLLVLREHREGVVAAEFSSDLRQVLSADAEGRVLLWNALAVGDDN